MMKYRLIMINSIGISSMSLFCNIKLNKKLARRTLSIIACCTLVPLLANSNEAVATSLSQFNENITAKLHFSDSGIPWGMAWLPNGDLLITLRDGELKKLKKGKPLQKQSPTCPK